jgi:hypothetical protein
MTKWIIVAVVVILAPTFVTNVFTNSVNFVSNQGRALFTEIAKEASETVKNQSQESNR